MSGVIVEQRQLGLAWLHEWRCIGARATGMGASRACRAHVGAENVGLDGVGKEVHAGAWEYPSGVGKSRKHGETCVYVMTC